MTETETPLAPQAAPDVIPCEALDETLARVHVALVPDLSGIGRLAELQARVHRNLPPETAARIAWVHPDAFCVVLGYLGRVRGSLIPVLQDVCRRLLPSGPRNLQAQRFSTGHDTEGTPRVLGVGFGVDSYLLELQSRLTAELAGMGLDVLPREFVPRLTLARLPEGLGPVMTVLEGLASGFPMTLRFPEADLAARGPRGQRITLERIVLARPRRETSFDRLHGCCQSQANRFAFPQLMDCPLKNQPGHELPCFETGTVPAHPVEEPGTADGKVDSGLIHEGTQELVRIGRGRPLGRAALLDAAHPEEDQGKGAPPAAAAPVERPRPPRPPQGQRPQPAAPRGQMRSSHRDPREGGGRDATPQKEGQDKSPRGDRPPRDNRDNRPPRENRDNRPPRDKGAPGDRPPGDRPPRENRDNRPPRDKGAPGDRPPRDNRDNRPPRDKGAPGDRPPGDRPPRENRDNRPPRDKGAPSDRPPRDNRDNRDNRPAPPAPQAPQAPKPPDNGDA